MNRSSLLKEIARNIARHGHHIYAITAEASPRFVYTIGLTGPLGYELIFPGGAWFSVNDVAFLINDLARQLRAGARVEETLEVEKLGAFHLRPACHAWINQLMLGARDYYRDRPVRAYQVCPDAAHWTIDIPDLSKPFTAASEPVWRFHFERWTYPLRQDSCAITDLAALRGEPVTHAARPKRDDWDILACRVADLDVDEARVVPLQTLIGADPTLRVVLGLNVGEVLSRTTREAPWKRSRSSAGWS